MGKIHGLTPAQFLCRQDALAGRKEEVFLRLGYHPHDMQKEVHACPARRRVVRWGRQMGKTTCSAIELIIAMMKDLARVWIVGPEYGETDKLYDLVQRTLCTEEPIDPMMPESHGLGIKPLRDVRSKGDKILVMPWGATLRCKSTKDVTTKKLAGESLDAIGWDECAFSPETAWSRLQPTLSVRSGWCLFTSTPNGDNHFRRWWERGWEDNKAIPEGGFKDVASGLSDPKDPMWESFYAESRDVVPWMPQVAADLDEYQRTQTEEFYDQEYRALFRSFVGQVYKEWDEGRHVNAAKCEYDPSLPLALTFDFGATEASPFVCLWIQWTDEGEVHILREYVAGDRNTVDNGNEVVRLNDSFYKKPAFFSADPSSRDQIKILKQHCKFRAQYRYHASKSRREIRWGIEQIRVMLRGAEYGETADGMKLYRPLIYVHPDCKLVRHEMASYSYPKDRANQIAPDIPVKRDDHSLDGLRYWCAVWIGKYGLAHALRAVAAMNEQDPYDHETRQIMLRNSGRSRQTGFGPVVRWF